MSGSKCAAVIERDFTITHKADGYLTTVEHDSLIIDTERDIWYWNSRDLHGTAYDWLTQVRGYSPIQARQHLEHVHPVPVFTRKYASMTEERPHPKLVDIFWRNGLDHRDYWYRRGYSDSTIDKFKLGWTGNCYVIPVIFNGELVNFQCRTEEKRIWFWCRGHAQPFNFDQLNGDTENVILCESPVDTIIATQYDYKAISVFPNAVQWKEEYNQYLLDVGTLYLAFDNDEAGRIYTQKVGKLLPGIHIKTLDWEGWPDKIDVGDVLRINGRSAMDELLEKALPLAAAYGLEDVYRGLREMQNGNEES